MRFPQYSQAAQRALVRLPGRRAIVACRSSITVSALQRAERRGLGGPAALVDEHRDRAAARVRRRGPARPAPSPRGQRRSPRTASHDRVGDSALVRLDACSRPVARSSPAAAACARRDQAARSGSVRNANRVRTGVVQIRSGQLGRVTRRARCTRARALASALPW